MAARGDFARSGKSTKSACGLHAEREEYVGRRVCSLRCNDVPAALKLPIPPHRAIIPMLPWRKEPVSPLMPRRQEGRLLETRPPTPKGTGRGQSVFHDGMFVGVAVGLPPPGNPANSGAAVQLPPQRRRKVIGPGASAAFALCRRRQSAKIRGLS